MARARRPWIVLPHDPIAEIDDNLWAVENNLPWVAARRRMFIVKRSDGTLLFSGAAIPLEDHALAKVNAWGRPTTLVVPHHHHMIDADAFAKKLGIAVYGPKRCLAQMRLRTEIAGTIDELAPDPQLRFETVVGTRMDEPALVVTSGDGRRVSLLFTDVIQNSPPESMPRSFRLLGFAGGPKVVPVFRLFVLQDRRALKAQIAAWAALPNLVRLVPCHGGIVDHDPAGALRSIAARL